MEMEECLYHSRLLRFSCRGVLLECSSTELFCLLQGNLHRLMRQLLHFHLSLEVQLEGSSKIKVICLYLPVIMVIGTLVTLTSSSSALS